MNTFRYNRGKLLAACMLALLPLMQGYPALILVAMASSDEDYAVVTVEIPCSADTVFACAIKLSADGKEIATGDPYEVEKVDNAARFMRVTGIEPRAY
ncbi:hypothetical protein [Pseudodesulfovibrio sp.]|uniref:hypothetical protein n=1 Tax=unclassified Pseudodesulfovibrio TaxID=2661612 RepID=UPI003B007D68